MLCSPCDFVICCCYIPANFITVSGVSIVCDIHVAISIWESICLMSAGKAGEEERVTDIFRPTKKIPTYFWSAYFLLYATGYVISSAPKRGFPVLNIVTVTTMQPLAQTQSPGAGTMCSRRGQRGRELLWAATERK